jgi:hypothetical protein
MPHIKDKCGVCFSMFSALSPLLFTMVHGHCDCNQKKEYYYEMLIALVADNLSDVSYIFNDRGLILNILLSEDHTKHESIIRL